MPSISWSEITSTPQAQQNPNQLRWSEIAPVSTSEDIAKTIPAAAVRAATKAVAYPISFLNPSAARNANAAIENLSGQPLYLPKSPWGEVVGRTIEATPEIALGAGAGSSIPAAIAEIGVGPALGGVGAHQAAEKLGAGPVGTQVADFVGSMLGGYLTYKGVNAAITLAEHLRGKVPTLGQLTATRQQAYKPAFESGTTVDPVAVQQLRKDLGAIPDVVNDRVARSVLGKIDSALESGEPIPLQKLQDWRSEIGKFGVAKRSPHGGELYGVYQDFIENSLQPSMQGPNKDVAIASWRAGDEAYKHELRADIFENANQRARGTWNWGKGVETQYRGLQKRSYPISTRHPPEERLFPEDLKQALTEYTGGTPMEKGVAMASKFAPWRLLGAIGSTGAAVSGHPLGILGSIGAGGVDIGRWLERMYHAQQVNDMARLGYPLLQGRSYPWIAAAPAAQQAFGGQQ